MPKGVFEDLSGRVFGELTVLRRATPEESPRGKLRKTAWWVKCSCGRERLVFGDYLRYEKTKVCGINGHTWWSLQPPTLRQEYSSERRSWLSMKERCYRQEHKNFKHYGGRGIVVCDRWKNNFEAFLEDMGPKPSPEHTIERMDTDGNYELGNCRWATDEEQRLNTRRTVFVEVAGTKVRLQDYAKSLNLRAATIYYRLKLGWSIEEAVTVPIRHKKSNKKTSSSQSA